MGGDGKESGMTSRFLASQYINGAWRRPGWLYLRAVRWMVWLWDMLNLKCSWDIKRCEVGNWIHGLCHRFLSCLQPPLHTACSPGRLTCSKQVPLLLAFGVGSVQWGAIAEDQGGKVSEQVFIFLVLPCRVTGWLQPWTKCHCTSQSLTHQALSLQGPVVLLLISEYCATSSNFPTFCPHSNCTLRLVQWSWFF